MADPVLARIDEIYGFPSDYLVFDLETTGLNGDRDLITQVGWVVAVDDEMRDSGQVVLNWDGYQDVHNYRRAVDRMCHIFNQQGKEYQVPWDRIKREGVEGLEGLAPFADMVRGYADDGWLIVGQNIVGYDCDFLNLALHAWQLPAINFPPAQIHDNGVAEKALGIGEFPEGDMERGIWFKRVRGMRVKQKWSLDEVCAPKYGLRVDGATAFHDAEHDCILSHQLYQTHKRLARECQTA